MGKNKQAKGQSDQGQDLGALCHKTSVLNNSWQFTLFTNLYNTDHFAFHG